MSNAHPLKRDLPDQFGADAKALTEQELWRREVCSAVACPKCKAGKGEFCNRANGGMQLRCHPERSRKFIKRIKPK
jgi:hypothetical protein